jgi:hypothetical protein
MDAGTGMGNEELKVNSDPEIVALETFIGAVPKLTIVKLLLFNNPFTMVVSSSRPNPLNIKTGAPACRAKHKEEQRTSAKVRLRIENLTVLPP